MTFRRIFLLSAMLFLAAAVWSQQPVPQNLDITQLLKRLELNEEELSRAERLIRETETVIREADLELNVAKAQLARMLFPVDVNMREVEQVLKQSYEWQLKRQLAQIRRQVELRVILGEERWEQYRRVLNTLQQRARAAALERTQSSSGASRSDQDSP